MLIAPLSCNCISLRKGEPERNGTERPRWPPNQYSEGVRKFVVTDGLFPLVELQPVMTVVRAKLSSCVQCQLLLVVYALENDYSTPVSDSLLSRAGLWNLGKGWIVRDTTIRRLPYYANWLFYPCQYEQFIRDNRPLLHVASKSLLLL